MAERSLTRRDFLKCMLAFGGAMLAGGCVPYLEGAGTLSPSATSIPRVYDLGGYTQFEIGSDIPSEIAFLSMASRYSPDQFRLITDPRHRDILSVILLENAKVAKSGFNRLVLEAIADGNACGLTGCGDSRVNFPKIFPNIPTAVGEVNVVTGDLVGIPVYRVGTQPAVFPKGVNISVFGPHQTAECLPGGCGAWGGIDTLINNPKGLAKLTEHGVSQMTIDELKRLYNQALTGGLTTPEEWSRVGARMQAELNAYQWGGTHYTAYGVYGHADDTFQAVKVIDNFGKEYSIDQFPKLKAVTSYINKPHPIIEEIAKGQQPIIIGINGSRNHTIPGLFGDLTNEPGLLFASDVDKIPGLPVSPAEARSVIAGADYGINVLPNKNFVVLVADNAQDMAVLRTTLLTEGVEKGSIQAFFERGGIIVEMMPDKTGRFTGLAYVRTAEDLMGDAVRIDFANSATMRGAIDLDSVFLGQLESRTLRDFELKVISESTKTRILNLLTFLRNPALRPIGLLAKLGLQFIGDYYMIKGFVEWFYGTLFDENLIYKNKWEGWDSDKIVWRDKTVLTSSEEAKIMSENPGAHRWLAIGRLDHIKVKQDDLVQAHAGAFRGWLKHGPKSENVGIEGEVEPWKSISKNDLGKLVTLEIPASPPGIETTTLVTTLVSKPNDTNFDGKEVQYIDTDPNQLMMLVDQTTGIPILGDVPGQTTTVAAIDPNNPKVRYFFEVTSVPKDRRFEFRLVGIGCNAPESANVRIPVPKDSLFAHREYAKEQLNG